MQAVRLVLLALLAAAAPVVDAYHLVPRGGALRQDLAVAGSGPATNASFGGIAVQTPHPTASHSNDLEPPEVLRAPNSSEIDAILREVEIILEPELQKNVLRPEDHRWGPRNWHPRSGSAHYKSAKEILQDFCKTRWHEFTGLIIGIVLAMILDVYVLQVHLPQVSFLNLVLQPLFWVVSALAVLMITIWTYSPHDGAEWITGYIYEWIFQLDNLLVCHIIFTRYKVPRRLTNRALTILLCGQLLNRLLFYLGLARIIHRVVLIRYVAGLLLVYGGYCALCEPLHGRGEAEEAPVVQPESFVTSAGRWLLENTGRQAATVAGGDWEVLLPAVGSMQVVDLILGADCAIAKIEEIDSTYFNITSSVMALFGLKAAYPILAEVAARLVCIQYGIGAGLVFIGGELLLMSYIDIGSFASITACVGLITVGALASLCFGPKDERGPAKEAEEAAKAPEDSRLAVQGG